jgi:hypothetical protein
LIGSICSVLRNLLENDDLIEALCFSCGGKYLATGVSEWGGNIFVSVPYFSSRHPPHLLTSSSRFGK